MGQPGVRVCVRVWYLSQVQRDVDFVVLGAPGQRGALPPALRPVDGVGDGVGAVAVALAAHIAVLTLRGRGSQRAVSVVCQYVGRDAAGG